METLFRDIQYGMHVLLKNRGFTAVAVVTLALGIGVNTAVFSVVNAVLLRTLPFPDAGSLVKISFNNPGFNLQDIGFTVPELEDLKYRSGIFEDVSVVWDSSVNMAGAEHPERLELLAVSPTYFSLLRVVPQKGRLFGAQDFTPGFADAVVISDALWNHEFGRDPNIIGRKVQFDNDPYIIAGILPPGFRHPGRTMANDVEVWAACGFSGNPYPKPARNVRFSGPTIGRLKPGISLRQAQAKLSVLASELRNEYPTYYPAAAKWSIEIEPLQESLVGNIRPTLFVLMAAAGLILLIACANIANLLLARAAGRQQEIAVRLALGAGPARIVRQMLTESILLSLIGSAMGVLAASGVLSFIVRLGASRIPRLQEVSIDWIVLSCAFLVSALTGVAFGLAPAIQSFRINVQDTVREGTRGSSHSSRTSRWRELLIVSELSLAVMLMVGAGLLLRTFWRLLQEDPGFSPSRVVAASFWLSHPNDPRTDAYLDSTSQTVFTRKALVRLRQIPGIEQADITTSLPITIRAIQADMIVEDHPLESREGLSTEVIGVTPGYFKLMQAPLMHGRFFNEDDETGKREVAIVDEDTAHLYWPGQDAVGRRIRLGQGANAKLGASELPWMTVVGVIKDIKHDGLDASGIPHVYRSLYQHPSRAMNIVLRTSLPDTALEPQIRTAIQAIDPSLPVFGVRSMDKIIDASLSPRRVSAALVGSFAVLALVLSSVGVYGLLAYMVGQRIREIGVRIALGAKPSDIASLVLRRGTMLATAGTLIGLAASAIIAPSLAALLYGVSARDPLVFVCTAVFLIIVAVFASYIPARRAARVDPIIALRNV